MVSNDVKGSNARNNMQRFGKMLLPWITGIALFTAVSLLFYAPQFDGKSLGQGDIAQYAGMSKDIKDHRAATGEDPQWTGNMFSGMPAYLIDVEYPTQYVKQSVGSTAKIIDSPMNMTLFAMLLMMVAVVLMGLNPWIGIIAGLAYGLSTYFFLVIDAGHITKMWALVYAPPLIASVWYALRKNGWLGAALAALFGSLELGANHPQITYYFLIVAATLWLSELWFAIKDKTLGKFGRTTLLLAAAALLALGSNFSPLWYTFKHQKYTTRGVAEAVSEDEARERKIAYNTEWSYGKAESFNMLVPDYMGRWSGDLNDKAIDILKGGGFNDAILRKAITEAAEIYRQYIPEMTPDHVLEAIEAGDEELLSLVYELADREARKAEAYASNYWGEQPFTAGPTYLGAAAIFLALLGMMYASGRDRWWIVASMLFMLLLAWGKNFMGFYELMYDILPGYSSFRTVSMALVVLEWAVPLLAAVALWRIWSDKPSYKSLVQRVSAAYGIVMLLVVIMIITADYGLADINAQLGDEWWVEQLKEAAYTARHDAMHSDVWRSMLYVTVTAGIVILYGWLREHKGDRQWVAYVAFAAIITVVSADLVGVGERYLNEDKWRAGKPTVLTPSEANRQILEDKELGYRVFDIDHSGTATAAYFHRSVDGYHGAKLGRYQELLERYIYRESGAVLAMLNTRYIIDGGRVITLADAYGVEPLGAAWFVEGAYTQPTPAKELEALEYVDLRSKAVVSESVVGLEPMYDATGTISLTEYAPNYLKYEYDAPAEALCVFSEIYFPEGWSVTIDGEPSNYFAANYALRAMELPAGKHTVEWRFRAPGWSWTTTITAISSVAILLALVAAIYFAVRGRVKNQNIE